MIMGTSNIQGVKLFVENSWKFLEDKTSTKYYVDQREAAVLSYSVTGLHPKLMTVDFYMKKKLISGYLIDNILKECLKDFKVSFDDIFLKLTVKKLVKTKKLTLTSLRLTLPKTNLLSSKFI